MRNCRRARPARYRCRRHKHTRAHTHTHTHTHEHNSTHTRAHTQHATPAHRPRVPSPAFTPPSTQWPSLSPRTPHAVSAATWDADTAGSTASIRPAPPHNCRSRGRRPGRGLHGVSCPGAPAPSDTYPRRGEVDEQDPPRVSVGSQRRPVLTFVRASGATPAQAGPLVGCWMAGRPAGHCCCS